MENKLRKINSISDTVLKKFNDGKIVKINMKLTKRRFSPLVA